VLEDVETRDIGQLAAELPLPAKDPLFDEEE
jgi:hypothetical protein